MVSRELVDSHDSAHHASILVSRLGASVSATKKTVAWGETPLPVSSLRFSEWSERLDVALNALR